MIEPQIELISSGPGYLVAASPRLFITTMEGEPTVESSQAQSAWAKRGLSKEPRSVGCLVVLGPTTTPPPPAVREQIPKRLRDIEVASAGLAMVIEGDGFRVATLRAVFTGFLLLRRLPYEAMVFSTVREGLRWLSRTVPFDPETAFSQIDHIRRENPI